MNNIFDIKRFGNFMMYELRRAWSNFGISALILGFLPLIFFAVVQFVSFIFTGSGVKDTAMMTTLPAFIGMMFGLILTMPVKMYGQITDKRMGSSYLMLPVSTFEKCLSMVIMCYLVAPLVICGLFALNDFLISAVFPQAYGNSALMGVNEVMAGLARETEGLIDINLPLIMFVSLGQSMLIFTLGAIFFKTAKAAKTILSLIAIDSVASSLMMAVVGVKYKGIMNIIMNANEAEAMDFVSMIFGNLNIFINVEYFLMFAIVTSLIYFRLKTIKQ